MTTVAPVNQRASVAAVFIEERGGARLTAGQWCFYKLFRDPEDALPAGILFGCPCGCGEMMSVGFDTHESSRPRWHWDGNPKNPTLTPSIAILQFDQQGAKVSGGHWHGFLTAGVFESC